MRVRARMAVSRWAFTCAALVLFPMQALPQQAPAEVPRDLALELDQLKADLAREAKEEEARRGAKIYARACAACHGREGAGDGPAAADLDPPPRDLQSGKIRFRTTPSGAPARPEDLERTIRRGLPGSSMPAFGTLFSAQEISRLVAFIESLQPSFSPPPLADTPPVVPAAVPALERSTAVPAPQPEGRALYFLLECWRCHGVDGSGRGPSSAGLTDEAGRPMRATDLRFDPFKGGREAEAVVRTLVTGLNGTPMPAYGEAMVFPREAAPDVASLDWLLTSATLAELEEFIRSMPDEAALGEMSDAEREALRQQRLGALAHYVLSLDRRRGPLYWLLREQPEREARRR